MPECSHTSNSCAPHCTVLFPNTESCCSQTDGQTEGQMGPILLPRLLTQEVKMESESIVLAIGIHLIFYQVIQIKSPPPPGRTCYGPIIVSETVLYLKVI